MNKNLVEAAIKIFLFLSICTLSLSVVRIFGGYSVTIAALFLLIYILYELGQFSINKIIVLTLIINYLLIVALVNFKSLDELEFLKSFFLTLTFFSVYLLSFSNSRFFIKDIDIRSSLLISAYVLFAFELLQIGEQLIFGTTSSWFWLDGISISNADDIGRFEAVNFLGYFRPTSFFHEPSYLALVSLIILIIVDKICPGKRLARLILWLSILLTFSSLIIGILLIYLSLDYLFRTRRLLLVVASFGMIAFLVGYELFSDFFRFNEISQVGTSGYVRFAEPFLMTKDLLSERPFGIPLGQSPLVYNNSLFLFPLYFGILSPIFFLLWIMMIRIRIKSNKLFFSYLVACSGVLLVNGAIFTIESAFLLMLLNYAYIEN